MTNINVNLTLELPINIYYYYYNLIGCLCVCPSAARRRAPAELLGGPRYELVPAVCQGGGVPARDEAKGAHTQRSEATQVRPART